jgi:hypothetical protein
MFKAWIRKKRIPHNNTTLDGAKRTKKDNKNFTVTLNCGNMDG